MNKQKLVDTKQIELPQVAVFDTTLVHRAITAGLDRHFNFEVVGEGPVPLTPCHHGLNYIEPVIFPPRALDKVLCILENDIPTLGYVIIHEPKVTEEKKVEVPDFKIAKPVEPIVPARDTSVVDFITTVGALAGAVAVGLGFMLLLAAQADPMLIVVLDDPQKTWLQIETWYS